MLTSSGSLLCRYTYDTWGNLKGTYDYYGNPITTPGHVGNINPIRYRGYFYDSETGFYYLQSRYYDPNIGRFINADGYISTGQAPLEHNMYTYCNNGSVNFSDPSGTWKQAVGGWQAQKGDTLWGLATVLYGNGSQWKSFAFGRDPKTLQVGEIIKTGNVGSISNGGESGGSRFCL